MSLSMPEIWTLVHADRRHLLDELTTIEKSQWETPSLCRDWTVHDVLAHLVDTAKTGKIAFIWSMVRAKGDFDRANDGGVRRCKRDDPRDTLNDFREVLDVRRTPPVHRATRLVEAIVHGEDIRRPLGISGDYPSAGVHEAIAYQLRTSASLGGSRELAEGCRLTDSETGSSWGEGSAVFGTSVDLLLALTGREIAPELLTGPGTHRLLAAHEDAKE